MGNWPGVGSLWVEPEKPGSSREKLGTGWAEELGKGKSPEAAGKSLALS